jgi:lipopolysaccharide biosynthesis glycosyltransferase
MNNKVTRLPIIVATDNHYIIMLAALIKSIEQNNIANLPIDLYIISEKVSKKNVEKLEKSINKEITSLIWYEMDEVILTNYKIPIDWTTFPRNIHARLYIPHFLPKEVEKILYLDVDMIVCRDIAELFEIDLGDNIVGAVLDQHVHNFANEWGGIKNYKQLGLSPNSTYFNTGLIMIDCVAWRSYDVTNKVINCIEHNKKFANFPDQYGLNVVLADRWKEFDPLWNYFSLDHIKSPYLIHFVKRKPFYKSYNGSMKFKQLFLDNLAKTMWKDTPEVSELNRYLKKISNILDKIKSALFTLF